MTDLFWPGDERAGDLFSQSAFLRALVRVESAWLAGLVDHGLAPGAARVDLDGLVADADLVGLSAAAESSGNVVVPLVGLLRERATIDAATWLHRGLTSQDVLDTALMLCADEAGGTIDRLLREQIVHLAALAHAHRDTPMVGRTLTQHAVPTTFGVKVAGWLNDHVDAAQRLQTARRAVAVQLGGAVGTLAASTELSAQRGDPEPALRSLDLLQDVAERLGVSPAMPWHTSRGTITGLGDAFVTCTDAWGHLASDVATLSRSEIGELHEGSGGGSSTMPHKQNPVLSVLLRRAAVAAPQLAATLHTAAALAVDERPDGAWHAEWATLATLGRRTVVAASQAADLVAGLQVDVEAMHVNLVTADGVNDEQASMAQLAGGEPAATYRGALDQIIDAALGGAASYLEETP